MSRVGNVLLWAVAACLAMLMAYTLVYPWGGGSFRSRVVQVTSVRKIA